MKARVHRTTADQNAGGKDQGKLPSQHWRAGRLGRPRADQKYAHDLPDKAEPEVVHSHELGDPATFSLVSEHLSNLPAQNFLDFGGKFFQLPLGLSHLRETVDNMPAMIVIGIVHRHFQILLCEDETARGHRAPA